MNATKTVDFLVREKEDGECVCTRCVDDIPNCELCGTEIDETVGCPNKCGTEQEIGLHTETENAKETQLDQKTVIQIINGYVLMSWNQGIQVFDSEESKRKAITYLRNRPKGPATIENWRTMINWFGLVPK